jgi:hypothetical protein
VLIRRCVCRADSADFATFTAVHDVNEFDIVCRINDFWRINGIDGVRGSAAAGVDRPDQEALTAPEPAGPPIRREIAEGELPRFVVQTEAPRTIILRGNYDKTNAVAAYVQPQFDYYHSEFLEMTTPDNYKGCGQFAGDQGACAQVMSSRVASGAIWQSVLRGMFKQPQQ